MVFSSRIANDSLVCTRGRIQAGVTKITESSNTADISETDCRYACRSFIFVKMETQDATGHYLENRRQDRV